MKINRTILRTPLKITVSKPELATAAPIKPPTRVCEELDGKPHHQVRRFQVIAAIRAAPITLRLITSGSTTPFAIVEETLRWKTRNAIKLKNAAIETAASGERTFVETTHAIELAES